MENTTETALLPIPKEEFNSIIEAAPVALQLNTETTTKALQVGNNILAAIAENGMNEELDARCNTYLVKAKERVMEMYDRRKPLTSLFDTIKTRFTELENQLAPKNANSIYAKIQEKRNEYATKKENERLAREAELKAKQEKENLIIEKTALAKSEINSYFEKYVEDAKKMLLSYFNGITIASVEHGKDCINSFPMTFVKEYWDDLFIPIPDTRLTDAEKESIRDTAKLGRYDEFAYKYKGAIMAYKSELIEKIPGKINYLKELANANAEKAKEMEAAEAKRKEDEAKRLEDERIANEQKANAKIEADKQNAAMEATFNNTVEILDNTTTGPNAITGHEIKVLNPVGWVQIFQKWFEKEGITKDNAAIGKKSLDQMKAFCEKLFTKDGERIESEYLEYETVYAVRAKK